MRSWSSAAAVAAVVITATPLARAEPTEQDKALATTLFNDAKALLAENRVSEACRKLEESRRLNPAPGTILNVAVCHEKEGLMASAFSELREARVLAERDHRSDRIALVDEHLKTIEPKISKLVVVVASGADVPQLRVTRDGTPLGRATWGTPIPVDPGDHVVEASAPGKKTRRATVTIAGDGGKQLFTVTPLEDEAPRPSAVADAPVTGRSGWSTVALAGAGAGVVAAGIGTFFGLRAIGKHGDPDATCITTPCSDTSVTLNRQAGFAADASTVSFAIALVALAASAVVWVIDAPGHPRSTVAGGSTRAWAQ
jgi:hypothetical protein